MCCLHKNSLKHIAKVINVNGERSWVKNIRPFCTPSIDTHSVYIPWKGLYVITLGKTCIVHISNFSTLVTHTIYLESQINVKYSESVEPLFFYHFKSVCHYLWFYGSPNEQNQTYELCMFLKSSHTSSQLIKLAM